jgi:hypothetical protein
MLLAFITQTFADISVSATSSDFVIEYGVRNPLDTTDKRQHNILVGYNGKGGNVVIPDSVTYIAAAKWVDSIQQFTFKGNTTITSLTIPDSVVNIDFGTFEDCTGLKSVRLSAGLTYITGNLFNNCTSLESVEMPASYANSTSDTSGSLFTIGPNAFAGTQLTNVAIPDGVYRIQERAFDTGVLETVTMPKTVLDIADNAFGSGERHPNLIIYGPIGSAGEYWAHQQKIGFNKPWNEAEEIQEILDRISLMIPINPDEINTQAEKLLQEKSAQRVAASPVAIPNILRVNSSLSNYENNLAFMNNNRTDKDALEHFTVINNNIWYNRLMLEKTAAYITKGVNGDYAKALAIHDFIATNMYYDYDLLHRIKQNGENDDALIIREVEYSNESSLNIWHGVCGDYAILTVNLLRALGIPAQYISGNTPPNGHAWTNAFVDNRWILIDTTWDSSNKWENGQITASGGLRKERKYFDTSLKEFSVDHRIGLKTNFAGYAYGDDFLGGIINDSILSGLRFLQSDTVDFVIPSDVTGIDCSLYGLRSLVIPNTVKTNDGVLSSSLDSLTIDTTELSRNAWGSSKSLILGENVRKINQGAFSSNFTLSDVVLPATVTEIDQRAFDYSPALKSVTILNPNAQFTLPDNWSSLPQEGLIIYGYPGSTAETWSNEHSYKPGWSCGTRFIPIGEPSDWAKPQVDRAMDLGLVPDSLSVGGYAFSITRAEFCRIGIRLYEKIKGVVDIGDNYYGTPFLDSSDIDVAKMASLGVVTGVGGGMFNPHSYITREQAAIMLSRLSEALGKPFSNSVPSFADNSDISEWAISDVGRIQNSGVMNGVGDNRFAPKGKYTREQSIATILHLYDLL